MPIPAQVQAQADAADLKLKELSTEKAPVVDPAKSEDHSQKLPSDEGETVEGLKKKLTDADHKLSVLQGKYNSEVQALKDDVNLLTTLKGQVRQLNGQLQENNILISGLQKELEAKKKEVAPVIDDAIPVLSDEDREYLAGEGFEGKTIEVLGRMVKALAQKDQAPAASREDIVAEVKREVQQETGAQRFWGELNDKVQDWETINGSDAFNNWLDENLPYTNMDRRAALKAAQGRLDYTTVIQMFNDFKGVKPMKKEDKQAFDPEKHIEPRSSVGRNVPVDDKAKGKIYTRQEVKDHYDGYTKGAWKGREDDWKAIDADILKANQEGRIQG